MDSATAEHICRLIRSTGPSAAAAVAGATLAVAIDAAWVEVAPVDGTQPYFWNKVNDSTSWDRPQATERSAVAAVELEEVYAGVVPQHLPQQAVASNLLSIPNMEHRTPPAMWVHPLDQSTQIQPPGKVLRKRNC